jgi:neurotransmitter:Na+ symporter, NSS family
MAIQQQPSEGRGQWGSNFGFIMAAAGSAVGLGNIWRFPYITGENGGGAFVFVYILCVLLIGLPLLMNELAIGRKSGMNPVGAIRRTGGKWQWQLIGLLCILVCFCVLSYYSVIAGWTIGFIYTELFNTDMSFQTFVATPAYVIPLTGLFMVLTILVILGGVSGGIEKAAKFLMPVLFLIVIIIAIKSVSLKGAMEGVNYYLNPDFSKINGKVFLAALGQAFFSLSVGWGLMVTYGSYLPKNNNIIKSSGWIAGMDSMVAILGGLMIFPALFALLPGESPEKGPALVFEVLPKVFDAMPGGNIIGALFFLLLLVAALTSSISMLEVPVSYVIDEAKIPRKTAAWGIGFLAFLLSIPSIYSFVDASFLGDFVNFKTMTVRLFGVEQIGFFNIMDFTFGTLAVVLVCLFLSIYSGWKQKPGDLAEELSTGAPGFKGLPTKLWIFFIRYVCPVVIALVILDLFGLFGEAAQGG